MHVFSVTSRFHNGLSSGRKPPGLDTARMGASAAGGTRQKKHPPLPMIDVHGKRYMVFEVNPGRYTAEILKDEEDLQALPLHTLLGVDIGGRHRFVGIPVDDQDRYDPKREPVIMAPAEAAELMASPRLNKRAFPLALLLLEQEQNTSGTPVDEAGAPNAAAEFLKANAGPLQVFKQIEARTESAKAQLLASWREAMKRFGIPVKV